MKRLLNRLLFYLFVGKQLQPNNEIETINAYLKRKGYDVYGNIYTKGFVVIEVKFKNKQIESISIYTDKVSKNKQLISANFTTSVIIAEQYFQRI
jgi:hypothetical protein